MSNIINTALDGRHHSVAVPDRVQGVELAGALDAIELGLGDRVAWDRYVTDNTEKPQAVRALHVAEKAYGIKALRKPRPRAQRTPK